MVINTDWNIEMSNIEISTTLINELGIDCIEIDGVLHDIDLKTGVYSITELW